MPSVANSVSNTAVTDPAIVAILVNRRVLAPLVLLSAGQSAYLVLLYLAIEGAITMTTDGA